METYQEYLYKKYRWFWEWANEEAQRCIEENLIPSEEVKN